MATSVRNLKPFNIIFRLTPIMMALSMITPFTTHATEQRQVDAPLDQDQYLSHPFHRDHILGTSLDVVMTGVEKKDAKLAFIAIENEIARLDKILSVWRDDSEITALNQTITAKQKLSPELFEVIAACENWRSQTCGAFDARLGQLIQAWEKSQGIALLDAETRAKIINHLDQNTIELDAQTQTIQSHSNIKFAPDAYAKGYIIDRALVAAREAVPELQGILIDLGGDMRVWGKHLS